MASDEIRNIAMSFKSRARIKGSKDRSVTVDEFNDLVEEISRALKKIADQIDQ